MFAYENNLHGVVLAARKEQVPEGRRSLSVAQLPPLEEGYAWRVNWAAQAVEAIETGVPAEPDGQEEGGQS